MSILPVKRLFCAVLFIALSNSVYAANICGPDAVDPDDDGWGWENGQSCRMNAVEPPAHTRCTNPDSDPDGDGWGWENGASCKVDAGPGGPGTDFDNAGRVQLNSSITGTFNGTGQHYYTFNVAENIIIDANNALLAFNIADGLPRWRHDVSEYTSVRNMVITDDGQVIVTLQDAILFFNE